MDVTDPPFTPDGLRIAGGVLLPVIAARLGVGTDETNSVVDERVPLWRAVHTNFVAIPMAQKGGTAASRIVHATPIGAAIGASPVAAVLPLPLRRHLLGEHRTA